MIRVLVFEDNPDFVDSLSELIHNSEGIELAGVCNNAKNIVKNVSFYRPDILLMDIDMPIENGLQGLRSPRASGSEICVLMLTIFDDNERAFQSICYGAGG